jgi:hypothetical protein
MYQPMETAEVKETFDPYLNGTIISGQPAEGGWPTWRPVMVIVHMETMEVLLMDLDEGVYEPEDYLEVIEAANR